MAVTTFQSKEKDDNWTDLTTGSARELYAGPDKRLLTRRRNPQCIPYLRYVPESRKNVSNIPSLGTLWFAIMGSQGALRR